MEPAELEQLALAQAQGDPWKALRLLAMEVCAQMQTGYYRPEPRNKKTLPIEKAPEPL